ncbi:alpha/beta hydrolase [Psychrobacillus sp. OK032]|uniref:alpha/beta hydrolase n=1 Tax=Psychrobacillus sp. OK032 TaxID=1884358 RepID=UPI0008CAC9B7|nr:alpha/beta hydrolase [Psychrobacillus sp. OK032]SER82248.1 Alpha/beta hydrolase family protein [Psychrobacillus sp. OK032]
MTKIEAIKLGSGDEMITGLYAPSADLQPKALIVAIHGGSFSSKYYYLESTATNSLLKLGSDMGYSVIAIDRPGYRAVGEKGLAFDTQLPILQKVISRAYEKYGEDSAGVFLVGHSIGAMISILLAAEKKVVPLLGMDVSGAGLAFHSVAKEVIKKSISHGRLNIDPKVKLSLHWGPDWTFSQDVLKECLDTFHTKSPEIEAVDALSWEKRVLIEGPRVTVPVQFTIGEYDGIWDGNTRVMERVHGIFSSSPFVAVNLQRFTAHNIHLQKVNRAFNLRTLAFLDECILYHSSAPDNYGKGFVINNDSI